MPHQSSIYKYRKRTPRTRTQRKTILSEAWQSNRVLRTGFMSLDDARSKMKDWRRCYNEERPHSGIGQNTPIQLHNVSGATSPSLAKEAENSSLR